MTPLARTASPLTPAARVVGIPLLAQALVGVAVGVLWWALAPTGTVVVSGDLVVAPDVPELEAAQDGTFALLAVLAGLLCGSALTISPGQRPVLRAAGTIGGGLVGAVVALGVGVLLGPASVAAQQEAGVEVLRSPLALSSYGVLGVWPAVAAAVAFAGLLLTGLLTGRRLR